MLEKTVSKEYHRITDIALGKSGGNPVNAMILKNYNDGRHGGWNNYCCYNNKSLTGSYVKKHINDDVKAIQHKENMAKAGEMIMNQLSGDLKSKMSSKKSAEGAQKPLAS